MRRKCPARDPIQLFPVLSRSGQAFGSPKKRLRSPWPISRELNLRNYRFAREVDATCRPDYDLSKSIVGSAMICSKKGLKERLEYGRMLRHKLKRSDHAKWDAAKRRHDPIEIILQVNRERIANLVPIKMARMALSPFGFFRGNVAVMAADLATLQRSPIRVQICGDAHVHNLGAYSAPDARLVFDINDFDETIRAPWEWDLRRLATSLILAGREAGDSERQCRDAVLVCAAMYRTKMLEFSRMACIEVHKYRTHRQFVGRTGNSVLQRALRETPDKLWRNSRFNAEAGVFSEPMCRC
jgi:Uncharacterized protein conserved in bacteria (DUF2252)